MIAGDNKAEILRNCEKLVALGEAHGEKRLCEIVRHAIVNAVDGDNPEFLRALRMMKRLPVSIDEFIASKDFLGGDTDDPIMHIWPTLVEDLKAINPDVMTGQPPKREALLGGATGTGKTTLCHATNMYQGYLFTCFERPQRLFNMTPATPIVFMFQSVSSTVTNRVIYKPFREMFTRMPYTRRWVTWDRQTESTLILEDNIQFVPALANVEAMVGQAIAGGMIDEANFMSVVQQSKRVPGARGEGGKFDQAEESYRNITRRRESRFTTDGLSMGIICTLSSTRYKDDFMDRRMAEVKELGESGIYVFRRKQYDVQPQFQKKGIKRFRLLVGTDRYPTRVLKPGEKEGTDYPLGAMVENVPDTDAYRLAFKRDPEGALRDIIGVATDTISAFIAQRHKIVEAIVEGKNFGLRSFVDGDDCDLSEEDWPQWDEDMMPSRKLRERAHWVHVDLSKNADMCGIAIVTPMGMQNVVEPKTGLVETVPKFAVVAVIRIKPSQQHPIDPGELRRWIMQLVSFYGWNIKEITYDGFQSQESMIAIGKSGIATRLVSMDRTLEPYQYLRRTIYEDRLLMVDHEGARVELSNLEFHAEKGVIDHPPKGSKDAADAICGAVYACSTSRYLRGAVTFKDTDGTRVNNLDRAPKRPRPQGSIRRK